MKNLICRFIGHKEEVHLDYIYGSLPREHQQCFRCGKTLKFEKPTSFRHAALAAIGDIRDGDVSGCKPIV